jgi:hypothetical protein
MKRIVQIGCVLLAGSLLWIGRGAWMSTPDPIDYRGETFKLTRSYSDYDDYKNDPENIDPSENARIERLVSEAELPDSFSSREELTQAVFDLKFPGYGLSCFSEKEQEDGSVLTGFAIEIPRAEKDRYLVFRGRNGRFTRIDDFVESSDLAILQVREEKGQLVYCNREGDVVLRRPLAAE